MQEKQNENTLNYSNIAVQGSQSSCKNYSIFETPAQNQMRQQYFLTHPTQQLLQQLMFSEQQNVQDELDEQFITPAKIQETNFNKQVAQCYAPQKNNPNKEEHQQRRVRDYQQREQPRLNVYYLGCYK